MSDETTAADGPQVEGGAPEGADEGPGLPDLPTGGQASGQAAPAADAGELPEIPAADAPAGPWFKYGEQEFADQAALTAHLDKERETARRERLNFDDYSQKTSEVAREREDARVAREALQAEQQQWAGQRSRYEQLDAWLRANPQQLAALQQMGGIAPQAQPQPQQDDLERRIRAEMEERYGPLVKQHEEQQRAEAWDELYAEVFGNKEVLPYGTDEKAVREEVEAYLKSPDKAQEFVILAARYHSLLKRQGAGTVAGSGNGHRQLNGAAATAPAGIARQAGEDNDALLERLLQSEGA